MPSAILATVTDSGGHQVVLDEEGWRHILAEHPDMHSHQAAVLRTITNPTSQRPDPRPGRLRYYREGAGPSRWLFVVVDCTTTPRRVVTTFGLRRFR